uniref:Uncharacterized protein n=1 Tax=Lepeophtheirus salmonis TaxID=72036 RepID=A0A0K2TEP9_LEPSM
MWSGVLLKVIFLMVWLEVESYSSSEV